MKIKHYLQTYGFTNKWFLLLLYGIPVVWFILYLIDK
ncbi:uncharacterized protein METZ01_LOCUS202648 [marine metagenome]|uniref:Uncharacterized protein n=1 Tax=marine metagenome TaxID=408172 RepID=A0A382EIA1_9ZZZZ